MNDTNVGDLFMDKQGKLWRAVAYCPEPTLTVEELEPDPQPNPALIQQAFQQMQQPATLPLPPRKKMTGGVSGLMWQGFKRIYSKEEQ
jgi:hypothetical protein